MESNNNKNNNNNDGEDKHQQLRGSGSSQIRKSNKLANDEDKPATTGEDQNCSSNKNLEKGNDLDLKVESLSREELVNLVRKQMTTIMEIEKPFERTKREAEASASRQTEELSQRNIQLEQEKAKLQKDLHQKMAKIVKMHTEMEEKSEELAKKANQIDELLMQLNESSHQHQIPTEQQMKIQLSLETWYDWLGFVPRHQLGKIVPMIGDRKFASIVQKFLHEYGEIMIGCIEMVAPYEEDPTGHPRVRTWQNHSWLRFEMAETQMPANIKNFNRIELRYFDQSVLKFMQIFQQNGLLENVNLWFDKISAKDIAQPVLRHLLPLINGIHSINMEDSVQLVDIYDTENSQEIYEMNMKMMEETRFLGVSYDPTNLSANKIDLYCRWLYQPARADGEPRVLHIVRRYVDYSPISLFIDRLKQDFLMATDPIYFFIRVILPKSFKPQEDVSLENDKTEERFQTKVEKADLKFLKDKPMLQISRYPLTSTKNWIVLGKEYYEKTIYLTDELKIVPIPI